MKTASGGAKKPGPEGCGNAGAVESVESQKQASHSFHELLGNLAKSSEISTFPTAQAKRSGKLENQKQVFHFPLPAPRLRSRVALNTPAAFGRGGAPRRLKELLVVAQEK